MERKYNIVLHAPLGLRLGQLALTQQGGRLEGTLSVLGTANPVSGAITPSGAMALTGTLTTKLITFPFTATGAAVGKTLELQVTGGRYAFRLTGEEMEEE